MRRKSVVTSAFDCGDGLHQVVTLEREGGSPVSDLNFRRRPCEQCPWRKDAPLGAFPTSAYRHSANTAYDMAEHTFACHMSGRDRPATCAGFLMRGADHNLSIRLAISLGRYAPGMLAQSNIPELYESYRAMAEANGVAVDDPALMLCRSGYESGSVRPGKRRRRYRPPP